MLKEVFNIHFICKDAPLALEAEIKEAGFLLTFIKNERDFLSTLSGNEIVVLDHYGLGSAYQQEIKRLGNTLVCIDDLHDKEFYADLIINHSPGIVPKDYHAQSFTQFCLGSDYVLLRPPFLIAAIKKEKKIKQIRTVLICFGGSDVKNLTIESLKVLLQWFDFQKIIIVTGAAFRSNNELELLADSSERIKLYKAIGSDEMASLLAATDLAIVPASGILLEALATGNMIISGVNAENQRDLFNEYKKLNAFISAEDFSPYNLKCAIYDCIYEVYNIPHIIDGYAGKRLLSTFNQLTVEKEVQLRRVQETDLELTYKWASNRAIRAYSFNQNDIKQEEHAGWFLSRIKDRNCYYYIAEWNQQIIGSIRFDIKEEVIISYLVDPRFWARGFGLIILKKGLNTFIFDSDNITKKIVGWVLPENAASCKTFEKLYFSKECTEGKYKYTFLYS